VHPHGAGADLDVWIERSLVRHGYGWSVPAGEEQRVGVGSYEPRDHVREPTVDLARRLDRPAVRYQGNWFPHRLRAAAQDGVFFVGDSAGHCFPLSGEGIRTAFYFGIACGRELQSVLRGERSREQALERYSAFSASHARAYGLALRLQWLIPRLPPRLLTAGLRAFARGRWVERAFGWYLEQAAPSYAAAPTGPAVAASAGTHSRTPSHSLP
jgi:flavin-dependent dehydrogenase